MICLCLTAETLSGWVSQIREEGEFADLFEFRLDLLEAAHRENPARLVRRIQEQIIPVIGRKPWIGTVRREEDLGLWPPAAEARRVRLIHELLKEVPPDYLDLEHWFRDESVLGMAKDAGVTRICSLHDTHGTPENLPELLSELSAGGGIAKLAVTPQSASDLLRLLHAARGNPRRRTRQIVLGMGEYGLPSRVAPAVFRSEWTYASPGSPGSRKAAPGQIGPRELAKSYRVGEVRESWPLFAVLGSPVAHSRSPAYHNRRFAEDSVRALYLPVRADHFDAFEELARDLPLQGVSVTVPHKETALIASKEKGELAMRVGAANTLLRFSGGWRCTNTDVEGFLSPLGGLSPRTALVIGAGGAARAVVVVLLERNVKVHICNRTLSRAQKLAEEMGVPQSCVHALSGPFNEIDPDIVVQTTTLGMEPYLEEDPIPTYRFSGREIVYDVIYTPENTCFLQRAKSAGCRTISGRQMFEAQADAQYRLFRALAT